MTENTSTAEGRLYLLGAGVTHSIAPPMHNAIAKSLNKPWLFTSTECPTLEDAVSILHSPTFVGGVITMPYKQSIIPRLSGIDAGAAAIGAVNNVYLAADGKLRGANTDWEGVKGCLISGDEKHVGRGKPALVIGAGGASRAAVYALSTELGCRTIYVINRDVDEVKDLLSDTKRNGAQDLEIVHVVSVPQAEQLASPYYIVGTVPDFEPKSESEIEMKSILEKFMSSSEKGVLLDMCFKPRNTRTMQLGLRLGWTCVEGTAVIGHQIETQYSLWTGENLVDKMPKEEAWRVLNKAAAESKIIN